MLQSLSAVKGGLGVAGLCLLRAGLRLYAAVRLAWDSYLLQSLRAVLARLARVTSGHVPAWGHRDKTLTLSLLFDLIRSVSRSCTAAHLWESKPLPIRVFGAGYRYMCQLLHCLQQQPVDMHSLPSRATGYQMTQSRNRQVSSARVSSRCSYSSLRTSCPELVTTRGDYPAELPGLELAAQPLAKPQQSKAWPMFQRAPLL